MKRMASRFQSLVDIIFGFDFFISYAHQDGVNYPAELASRLEQLGYRVFLDSRVYVVGDDLRVATRRRIKMSKKLIVVARPKAIESRWVLREVDECLNARRTPIVIDVNEAIRGAGKDSELRARLQDKLQIREYLDDSDQAPSDQTISSLAKSFKSTRQDILRLRLVSGAAVLLLATAVLASWQFAVAVEARAEAERQRDNVLLAYASMQNMLVESTEQYAEVAEMLRTCPEPRPLIDLHEIR